MTTTAAGVDQRRAPRRRPRRPPWLVVVLVGALVGVGRELVEVRFGWLAGLASVLVLVGGFRLITLWRRARGQDLDTSPERIAALVRDSAVGPPAFPGDGTLLGAPIIAVAQRTKLFEAVTEYGAFDEHGALLATIRQIGQSRGKRLIRLVSGLDIFFTHRFEVRDPGEALLGTMVRPAKIFLSRVELAGPGGEPAGTISQRNVFGRIGFRLDDPFGFGHGRMRARGWRAWDFDVVDHQDQPVAEVVKAWEGFSRTIFTTSDRYVLRLTRRLHDPLRTLVVASALAIDVALKQDNKLVV